MKDLYLNLLDYYNFLSEHIYIKFAILFILLYFIAHIVNPILFWLLSFLVKETKTDLDDKIFEITKPAMFWSIIFIALLALTWKSGAGHASYTIVKRLVYSTLIIIWASPLVRTSATVLATFSKSKKSFIKPRTLPLFKNMSLVIIWSFAIYFLFAVWGISLTAWLASAGIIGIAVGFAAKDTLANLISGVFILADAPYKVGDIIVLDSGEKGEVLHVGVRSTRIRTLDGVEITIPNASMGNSKIVNETGTHVDKKLRVRIPVGISYEDDIEKAEEIMLNIAHETEEVCDTPKPKVAFVSFGASSLDLELRVWVEEPGKRGATLDRINRRILQEFRNAKIEIPYSKMDVYIKENA